MTVRESPHKLPSLVLQWAPTKVLGLLFHWAEWRSLAECPKSPRLTSVADLVAVPGLSRCHFAPPSTAPKDPRPVEEFNQAFLRLLPIQQEVLRALVAYHAEPWLAGQGWGRCLECFGVTRENFEKLLADALQSLTVHSRRRGLC